MVEGVAGVFFLLYTLLLLFTCGRKKKKAVGSPSEAENLKDSSKNQLKSASFSGRVDEDELTTLNEMAFEKIDSDITREPFNVAIANQVRNIRNYLLTLLGEKKSENDAKGASLPLESTAKSETVSAESHENQPITTTTTESSDRTQETLEDSGESEAGSIIIRSTYMV